MPWHGRKAGFPVWRNFQSNDADLKSVLAGYFRLQALEQRAGELLNPPALETRQMNVVHVRFHFVEVLLTAVASLEQI